MGERRQERTLQHLSLGRALGLPPLLTADIENNLVNVPSEDGLFGNAVYDAVGIRIKELPLSAERVLDAIQGQDGTEYSIDVEALRKTEADQR